MRQQIGGTGRVDTEAEHQLLSKLPPCAYGRAADVPGKRGLGIVPGEIRLHYINAAGEPGGQNRTL